MIFTIRFSFEENGEFYEGEVSKNTQDEINQAIWTLFNVLNAYTVILIKSTQEEKNGKS